MKILWVSNSPIGPSADILGMKNNATSGGWIRSEFDKIQKTDNEFFFLCSSRSVKKHQIIHQKGEQGEVFCVHSPRLCYGIDNPKYLVSEIENIVSEIDPEIIHIWGTETCISNIVASVKTKCPKVVFLQGLIGIHKRYLGGYEEHGDRIKRSIKEKLTNLVRTRGFYNQAKTEQDTIKKCGNVISDGMLAHAYINSISERIKFYSYVLLPNAVFQKSSWEYSNCLKRSIFTVYSGSAEKGLQQLLKAVALIRHAYPDVLVKVPGTYSVDRNGRLNPSNGYERLLQRIIGENGLQDNIVFVGKLGVEQMAEQMRNANCFVNPSIMEVHALSLREAMSVGVPCISTVCGNVTDYLQHGRNGFLYRFEEYEVLAEYLKRVFDNEYNFDKTDFWFNDKTLLDVYKEILV